MKPTGQIELAFETGLMFYFAYGLGYSELQVDIEHSMDDLLNFLMLFLVRVLLKPSFLRQLEID